MEETTEAGAIPPVGQRPSTDLVTLPPNSTEVGADSYQFFQKLILSRESTRALRAGAISNCADTMLADNRQGDKDIDLVREVMFSPARPAKPAMSFPIENVTKVPASARINASAQCQPKFTQVLPNLMKRARNDDFAEVNDFMNDEEGDGGEPATKKIRRCKFWKMLKLYCPLNNIRLISII